MRRSPRRYCKPKLQRHYKPRIVRLEWRYSVAVGRKYSIAFYFRKMQLRCIYCFVRTKAIYSIIKADSPRLLMLLYCGRSSVSGCDRSYKLYCVLCTKIGLSTVLFCSARGLYGTMLVMVCINRLITVNNDT